MVKNASRAETIFTIFAVAAFSVGAVVTLMPASWITQAGYRIFGSYVYNWNQSNSWVPWMLAAVVFMVLAIASSLFRGKRDKETTSPQHIRKPDYEGNPEVISSIRYQRALQEESDFTPKKRWKVVDEHGKPFVVNGNDSFAIETQRGKDEAIGYVITPQKRDEPKTLAEAMRQRLISEILHGKVRINEIKGSIAGESLNALNPDIKFEGISFAITPEADGKDEAESRAVSPPVIIRKEPVDEDEKETQELDAVESLLSKE